MDLPDLYLRFTFDLVARKAFDHLHWGSWKGLPPDPARLAEAQQAFARVLIAELPGAGQDILDVGCGLGGIAQQLSAQGQRVVALTPRTDHAERIRAATGQFEVRDGRFEDLDDDERFDRLLFAESFNFFVVQSAPAADASVREFLERCRRHLRPLGQVVLADIVTDAVIDALRGSASAAAGFRVLHEEDVSEHVAFTAEALQALIDRAVRPYHELVLGVLEHADPPLRRRVEQTLNAVDNQPLRELFAGRMVESELSASRRYMVFRLARVDPHV